ncbi:MAG: Tetratricopeptide 2 repeat protein [Bacteroidetes bacterium]|nr:Tetratricopeptide 2 repeat protein [Bacteroidota bacterium]
MTGPMRTGIFCFFFCLLPGPAPAQTAIDSTLRMVDSLYTAGSYSLAELEARRMLENDLLSDSLRVAFEQWVAFSLVAQGKTALAKEHFLSILRRTPSHELDPILTSPKILAVFNDARATYLAARTQGIDSSPVKGSVPPEGITFRTIVFPGWEQWYHGRTPIGPILAGAGIATLGSAVTFAFLRSSARQEYLAATTPEDIEAKYDTYNRYSKAESYCFAAFAVVYLLSEIEVFTHNSAVTISPELGTPAASGSNLKVKFSFP